MLYLSNHFSTLKQAQKELKTSAFFLLDIHQVLFHRRGIFTILRGIAHITNKSQTFKESIQTLCSLKTWKSLHGSYKRGNRITEAYLNATKQRPHLYSELINYSNTIYTADTQMAALLTHLKKLGHERYLLSNIGNTTLERLREAYPAYFSLITDTRNTINRTAHDEHSLVWKPQLTAYHEALNAINKATGPHLAIFIDDTKRNVQAAHTYGMNAILFRSVSQCKRDIETLLGSF